MSGAVIAPRGVHLVPGYAYARPGSERIDLPAPRYLGVSEGLHSWAVQLDRGQRQAVAGMLATLAVDELPLGCVLVVPPSFGAEDDVDEDEL